MHQPPPHSLQFAGDVATPSPVRSSSFRFLMDAHRRALRTDIAACRADTEKDPPSDPGTLADEGQ